MSGRTRGASTTGRPLPRPSRSHRHPHPRDLLLATASAVSSDLGLTASQQRFFSVVVDDVYRALPRLMQNAVASAVASASAVSSSDPPGSTAGPQECVRALAEDGVRRELPGLVQQAVARALLGLLEETATKHLDANSKDVVSESLCEVNETQAATIRLEVALHERIVDLDAKNLQDSSEQQAALEKILTSSKNRLEFCKRRLEMFEEHLNRSKKWKERKKQEREGDGRSAQKGSTKRHKSG